MVCITNRFLQIQQPNYSTMQQGGKQINVADRIRKKTNLYEAEENNNQTKKSSSSQGNGISEGIDT